MHGFDPVTLGWNGEDFVVPAQRQLMLIAQIEDALAGPNGEQAVMVLFRPNGAPHTRLAAAYGAALRYAGAKVTDEEIYLSIHEDIASGSQAAVANKVQTMLAGLLAIISPPTARALSQPVEVDAGKKRKAASSE
jgi:hypothetical protein